MIMDKISVVNFFLSYPDKSLENNNMKEEIKRLQQQLNEEYNSSIHECVETLFVEESLERINQIQEYTVDIYSKMYVSI